MKLHLGCGNIHIQGFVNIDIAKTPAADIVDDVTKLERVPSCSAEVIYACHVLEHFSHDEVPKVLTRWRELLTPDGEIRISVPDIDRIVRVYTYHWEHFQTPGNSPWIGLLYGGQGDPYDFHKTGFNFCWMKHIMEGVGFHDIEEYPHTPHWIPGLVDASLANQPFDKFLSLNVKAVK